MSAIGDYIHLSAYGYNVYGSNKIGGTPQDLLQKRMVFINQYNKARLGVLSSASIMSVDEKQRLGNLLSIFTHPLLSNLTLNQELAIKEMFEIYKEFVSENLGVFSDQIIDNYKIGGHHFDNDITLNKISLNTKNNQLAQDNIHLSTILNRIVAIENSLSGPLKNALTNGQLKEIQTALTTIKGNLKTVSSLADKILSSGLNYKQGYLKGSGELIAIQEIANGSPDPKKYPYGIITMLNKIIGTLIGSRAAKMGKMFLAAVGAISAYYLGEYSEKTLKEYMAKAITENTSKQTYKNGLFADFITEGNSFLEELNTGIDKNGNKIKVTNFQLHLDGSYVSVRPSNDKVDFTMFFEGKPLPLSLKNVDMGNLSAQYKDIKLALGMNFLAFLASLDADYVNHYLNVKSKHSGDRGVKGILGTGMLYLVARNSIRLSLLIAAFQGYRNNAQGGQAKVFVINDNRTGRIEIYNIAEIIQRVLLHNYFLNKDWVTIENGSHVQIDLIIFNNPRFGGTSPSMTSAAKRIINLLGRVHQQKISVGISKKVFSEFY